MTTLDLPGPDGTAAPYALGQPSRYAPPEAPLTARVLYAAVHVVADPEADNGPGRPATLDWEATLRYRHHLWSYGLGVAEAMDTAQRGMGLDWAATRELIERSLAEARAVGGLIACGAGTDQLPDGEVHPLERIAEAYAEQCAFIEERGGRVILMASRALAASARDPDDYARVYGRVLDQVSEPVILHWLGEMFDPKLAGYWVGKDRGSRGWREAMESMLTVIADNRGKIDGMKMSLLDDSKEIAMRRRLPEGVRMYTGDDFHYPSLIRGDAEGFSHALLGIFDAIAPAASAAVTALQRGDVERFDAVFAPTVPLSKHIFEAPTYYYKTGIVFLAYLNGHQDHFRMVGGLETGRSTAHLVELFKLADGAGLLRDPELAAARMRATLEAAGAPT